MSTLDSAQELPKVFDHQAAQQRWYPFWEAQGYFNSDPDPNRKPFTIVIPPPNVTGALHLGHALNNTLQDILIRWRRMQGYNALWIPGTDHAGIATQAVVERRLFEEEKQTRHDLGREALVARIWKWKDQYEARILGQLKRMGFSCDWRRTRFTLDEICARAVRRTFFSLFSERLVYRGKRLVNWDTFLQTAVSDDEVFHETIQGHFWHLQYSVIDPQPGEPASVTVATTRPETMLGDTAVAVHPDPASALAKIEAELRARLAVATEKDAESLRQELDRIAERRQTHLAALEQLRDMALAGRQVMLPLLERPIPLVADAWAKPELGSGCVKITPAHDPNDYEVAQRQRLPKINILNPEGTLNDQAGAYRGLTIRQARQRVVADLEQQGRVLSVEDREIELAHSERSKTPIEPFLADQWFVKMDQLAQSAIDAVVDGQVKIIPERYAKGYIDWLSEKRDWPVGRQLWWGHRVPIWARTVTSSEELDALIAQIQADEDYQAGRVAYEIVTSSEQEATLPAVVQVCIEDELPEVQRKYEQRGFIQDSDVLDTWFSSALWPHSTLGWPEPTAELAYYYPTSTLITNRDIITLWVARMVLAGLHNVGEVPFHEVYIHPTILDAYGERMSKSKGNGVDPIDVLEKIGADALRFGLTYLTTETQDVRIPVDFECPHCEKLVEQTKQNRVQPAVQCPHCKQQFATQWADLNAEGIPRAAVTSERFELGRNFCTKLWNASRFALLNLDGYSPAPVEDDKLAVEDRWLLSRLATVTDQVTQQLTAYQYAEAARTLYDFAWDEFCSFYVEMAKERLQRPESRPVAQRVLAAALDTLMRLLHPMLPFLTEEVWQRLNQAAPVRGLQNPQAPAPSVMIASWPEVDRARQDAQIERQFSQFQAVLGSLREIRSSQNIAPRAELEFIIQAGPEVLALLEPMKVYFQSMAGARPVAWGPGAVAPEIFASRVLPGLEVFVDLKSFIDVPAEIARLEKEEQNKLKFVAGKQQKLQNESFVSRAPAAVIEKEREGLALAEQELASIRATLALLRQR